MDQKEAKALLNKIKEQSNKRNFKQAIDMVFILKNLNLKKPDQQVDFFTSLHYPLKSNIKICGLVGPELYDSAKESLDKAIHIDDFPKFETKKDIKKLAGEYDYFVAQANIMAKIAQKFGRILGPRGKMPNPKAGCVVPPNANLNNLVENLKKLVHIKVKSHLMFQTIVGYEDTEEEQTIDNMMVIYNQLLSHLILEKNNLADVMIKYTMGKPAKLSNLKN